MKKLQIKRILAFCIAGCFCFNISLSQNQKPVAVRDTASVMAEIPINVLVLHNDYDPEGDSIKISTVYSPRNGTAYKKNDSVVRYASYYNPGKDSLLYSIRDTHGNISQPAWLVINVIDNPDLPFANGEEAATIACDSLVLNLTKNDTDPNNDTLFIDNLCFALYDQVLQKINDSMILYRSYPDFAGTDTIKYRVRSKHNLSLYSNYAKAVIHVTANPDIPVAVSDSVTYLSFSEKTFFPMQNDLIPTQDSMEIVFQQAFPPFLVVNDDQSVKCVDSVRNIEMRIGYSYKIRRKSDPCYYSNFAKIWIDYSHNPQYFYANNDSASLKAFSVLVKDVLANDFNPDPADTLWISLYSHGLLADSVRNDNGILTYYPDNRKFGVDTIWYMIRSTKDSVKYSTGMFKITLTNKYGEYLDVNNVRALFFADGLHFFREDAEYEVPKGSRKTSLFSNSLWVGGMDEKDSLHFAGEKYRQGPFVGAAMTHPDYYVGPVMDSIAYGYKQDSAWSYIWKLNRSEIEYHKAHFSEQGYQPIQNIATWPGNGNVSLGQAAKLAPYVDFNADGIYNPMDGDYPEVRGDQALFFIYNDDRGPHMESLGRKLKMEIQGMAYAFDRPNDTALNDTTFLHYTVINRSDETYSATWFGIFTDIDLGYSADDYIGCDVERNMYYGFNGPPLDGSGQPQAYGEHPPVQAVVLLGGPKMDDDGIDNPKFDNLGNQLCDESVNGVGFGDTVTDNERYGMRKFVYCNNALSGVPPYMTDPYYAPEYYNMMNGIWKDGTRMIYGGNAHASSGGYGPACDFIFPGNSDSLNWGVGCNPPNGPVYWTEVTATNAPYDRRGLASTGPVTFKPGDRQDIDIAFAWARDYTSSDPNASLVKLQGVVDKINKAFAENRLPDGTPIYGIPDHAGKGESGFRIYPNPAKEKITLEIEGTPSGTSTIRILNLQGKTAGEIQVKGSQKLSIDVSGLEQGVYIVQLQSARVVKTRKLILVK